MAELSDKSIATIHDLTLIGKPTKSTGSAKRRRVSESKTLLTSLGIKHRPECMKCGTNCTVKHMEDPDFWAVAEGLDPVYDFDTCPKKMEVATIGLKELRKSQRKRR